MSQPSFGDSSECVLCPSLALGTAQSIPRVPALGTTHQLWGQLTSSGDNSPLCPAPRGRPRGHALPCHPAESSGVRASPPGTATTPPVSPTHLQPGDTLRALLTPRSGLALKTRKKNPTKFGIRRIWDSLSFPEGTVALSLSPRQGGDRSARFAGKGGEKKEKREKDQPQGCPRERHRDILVLTSCPGAPVTPEWPRGPTSPWDGTEREVGKWGQGGDTGTGRGQEPQGGRSEVSPTLSPGPPLLPGWPGNP